MLSYTPDTADKGLSAARDRMTGPFRDSYASLIKDVVIPGAQQKKVTAVATVAAAASVSATPTHAVVLLYVNQAITMADGAPTQTNSTVEGDIGQVHRYLADIRFRSEMTIRSSVSAAFAAA